MSAAEKFQQHPAFVQARTKVDYCMRQLDKELATYPVLATFEQRTQVPKTYVAISTVFFLTLFHFVHPLAAPVSNFIAWALPACLSFKALETPGHQDDVQWLTYWVIFGFLNCLETIALKMMLYYIPGYYAWRTVFFLWLQLPALRGAQVTYVMVRKHMLSACGSSRAPVPTDTLSDGLRDRVNVATSE